MAKWKPSKTKAREFAQQMQTIKDYCYNHNIAYSSSMDSYYFTVNGQSYRVSNHSVESSNKVAYHDLYGKTRELYHPSGRTSDTVYIYASKTRLIEIHQSLLNNLKIDSRGYLMNEVAYA